ncbi:MAG TPA: hypothetical protein VLE27_11185 [Thermoanaerobaculia bacterium]|nr:hypothetical protein [Thermoanaerobaculia bacterium]
MDRLLLAAQFDTGYKRKRVLAEPEVEGVVTSLFADRVLERRLVRRWPGTEMSESLALVFVIDFDPGLIQPMAKLGPLLENWRHSNTPPLPEDLCLFRQGDEWPVLISVTHERDAWILSEDRPPFCTGEPFDFKPENLLVPSAEDGFVGM